MKFSRSLTDCPVCHKPMGPHCRVASCTWLSCRDCSLEMDKRNGHVCHFTPTKPKEKT